MKILNLMKILLLCVMTAGLASCGDDNYYTIQNSDEKLCSDSWVEEYDTEEGACRHILEFTKGKQGGKEVLSGKETFIVPLPAIRKQIPMTLPGNGLTTHARD